MSTILQCHMSSMASRRCRKSTVCSPACWGMLFWWNCSPWLHRCLSFWQLSMPMRIISSKWQHLWLSYTAVLLYKCTCRIRGWCNQAGRLLHYLAVVFAQSIVARSLVENEDVVGAAPIGDAPITFEWSTILLPTKVRLKAEVLR